MLLTIFSFKALIAQKKEKNVLLDGKPAILNTETGEVTLKNTTPKKNSSSEPVAKSSKTILKKEENLVDSESDQIDVGKHSDFHTVKAGETLFALSKRYGTTLAKLKEVNHLSTTLIRVGQILLVQNFDSYLKGSKHNNVWTVSKGDTLYNIGNRNNISVNEIKQLNGLKTNTIYIGQKLRLK